MDEAAKACFAVWRRLGGDVSDAEIDRVWRDGFVDETREIWRKTAAAARGNEAGVGEFASAARGIRSRDGKISAESALMIADILDRADEMERSR